MCGIAGVVRREGAVVEPTAAALDRALAHRGPDGRGAWRSDAGTVVLVHRRLVIIDPTLAGAQPMATADGRHRIVFNGEVYNYRDLRADLEARGELPFATWMRGELQPFVCDGIAHLEDEQWIARGAGAAVVDAWTRGGAHWSRPWALGVLGQFLDQMSRPC